MDHTSCFLVLATQDYVLYTICKMAPCFSLSTKGSLAWKRLKTPAVIQLHWKHKQVHTYKKLNLEIHQPEKACMQSHALMLSETVNKSNLQSCQTSESQVQSLWGNAMHFNRCHGNCHQMSQQCAHCEWHCSIFCLGNKTATIFRNDCMHLLMYSSCRHQAPLHHHSWCI